MHYALLFLFSSQICLSKFILMLDSASDVSLTLCATIHLSGKQRGYFPGVKVVKGRSELPAPSIALL
jgi:hypothetical protein